MPRACKLMRPLAVLSFLAPRGAEAIELGAESNDCMETSMANLHVKSDSYFSAMIERWLFLP